MDERIMQFRVGVVVLAVGLIAGFLVLLFGHFRPHPQELHRLHSVLAVARRCPDAHQKERRADRSRDRSGTGRRRAASAGDGRNLADYTIWHDEVVRLVTSLLGDADLQVEPANKPWLPHNQSRAGRNNRRHLLRQSAPASSPTWKAT